MLLVAIVLLALVLVPLAGGRLGALLDLRFRGIWLLALALTIQLALALAPGETSGLRLGAHAATFPMGLGFIWLNRRVPGLWLIGLGALANGAAIVANGGVMPASLGALRSAGLDVEPSAFANSAVLADPELAFLGDVFAIPAPWPLANVFSVGDVLIALGAAYAIHAVCGSRLVPRRSRWDRPGGITRPW